MNKYNHALATLTLAAALLPTLGQAQDDAATGGASPARTVRSAAGFESVRGDADFRPEAEFLVSETRPGARRNAVKGDDSRVAAATGMEAWFYDADVELFDDYDLDGYYRFIRVRFDVDSIYADHYVYARLFVTSDGENWDEYHVTDDFLVNGSSSLDDYEVETEFLSGFPPGLYDVLIELYDADYGAFLAEFGPADSSAFSLLPIEDASYDVPPAPIITITEEHGGGSTDPITLVLLGLMAVAAAARWQRARPVPVR